MLTYIKSLFHLPYWGVIIKKEPNYTEGNLQSALAKIKAGSIIRIVTPKFIDSTTALYLPNAEIMTLVLLYYIIYL